MDASLRTSLAAALTASLALFSGCGKVQESAAEKAAEKAIEAGMAKDGGKAKVDLSGGGMKIQTTDASGKTSQMEMGSAQVTEAELGVPFYPGTKPGEGQSTKISTPDGNAITTAMHSDDAAEKVAEFFRQKLKAQAEGKQFTEMSGGGGNYTLMLADEKDKGFVQVHVNKADKGSDIMISAHRKVEK